MCNETVIDLCTMNDSYCDTQYPRCLSRQVSECRTVSTTSNAVLLICNVICNISLTVVVLHMELLPLYIYMLQAWDGPLFYSDRYDDPSAVWVMTCAILMFFMVRNS